MSTPRGAPLSTMLPTGKVLVEGGFSASGAPTASAELYDPLTGTWSSTGSMDTPRACDTATLLPNGNVLVAGGSTSSGLTVVATAELYDPSTGTWSSTGSMGTPRCAHRATLLPNGKVLVAGGINETSFPLGLASAELYDPLTGSWSPTGSMGTGRDGPTATLLPSGQVLLAGGIENAFGPPTATTELYDAVTGTWSPTGSLGTGRWGHTATLLPSGNVLAAGGRIADGNSTATAELYDPSTGTWTSTGSMASGRGESYVAPLLPSGDVLVAGGINCTAYPTCTILATAELYDPSTGTWSATGSMSTPRRAPTGILLPDGHVLVAGGDDGSANLSTAELYTPTPPPLPNVVVNTNDSGPGSLRAAIEFANTNPGPDTILFAIPASDPGFNGRWFSIRPTSPLPALTDDGTTIDGSSQSTFAGDTNPSGPEIELNGSVLGDAPGLLDVRSSSNRVDSLVLDDSRTDGIKIGGSNNVVTGSYIGIDPTGTSSSSNGNNGIELERPGTANRIGGTTASERNVLSGNAVNGIQVHSDGNVVEGNYVGTDASGTHSVGNTLGGVNLAGASGNTIGGTDAGAGNLVSGNPHNGVNLDGADGNIVRANVVGTTADGSTALPNAFHGISVGLSAAANANTIVDNVSAFNGNDGVVVRGSSNTRIVGNNIHDNHDDGVAILGGATGSRVENNTIQANGGSGVRVTGATSLENAITRNSMVLNGGLGIDLDGGGVTPNDPGDVDTGPNQLMNFPELKKANADAGANQTVVVGSIDTPNPATVVIEFFANDVGDPSRHGEGTTFLGTITPKANGKFVAKLPLVPTGTAISATATDADGNTSEFAANLVAK